MSSNLKSLFSELSIADQRLVLEVTSDFERAWISANASSGSTTPSIEQHLFQFQTRSNSQSVKTAALIHLLLLNLEYCADRGETPNVEDYLARFPGHENVVRHCFSIWKPADSNFDNLKPLAEGGLGVVSLAHDRVLHRTVAFKQLKAIHAQDPVKQFRFRREAEITGRLQHPGIIAVYSFEESSEGNLSYAMRLIGGEQLASAIVRFHSKRDAATAAWQRTELRKLLRSFVDACHTIAYAHSEGCIHRDIKPQNIMLGKFGETIVVDWGLAKYLKEPELVSETNLATSQNDDECNANSEVTRTGDVFGTPMFMSPEQAAGKFELVGPRSDIYSLGVTLCFLLTGQYPFPDHTVDALWAAIKEGRYRKPSLANPNTPQALEAICQKCMALDPVDRYESAMQLATDVENWMAYEPVSAHAESLLSRLSRLVRRHPTWMAIGTVATSLMLIGLSIIGSMTAVNNRRLSFAADKAKRESARADQMLQFFVDELSAASPENATDDRVQSIAQLMEHMVHSAEQFRESNAISYAKLLWNISKVSKARSEYQTAQRGFETLLGFLKEQSENDSDSRSELTEMIVPAKLELASCYMNQRALIPKIESLMAGVLEENLDENYTLQFAEIMAWLSFYDRKSENAQQILDRFPRGLSYSLDRHQANVWSSVQNEQKACELLNELVGRIPKGQQKDAVLLYNAMADIHRRFSRFEEAEQCSLKSIQLADRYYTGYDQYRLMPRGQLMDVCYGDGQFDKALGVARQLEEIVKTTPDGGSVKHFLPLVHFRICIFKLATPKLSRKEAEALASELEGINLTNTMNATDIFELISVRYLVYRFLGLDELATKCLSEAKGYAIERLRSNATSNSGNQENTGTHRAILFTASRLRKVASANNLTDDLERLLSETNEALAQ